MLIETEITPSVFSEREQSKRERPRMTPVAAVAGEISERERERDGVNEKYRKGKNGRRKKERGGIQQFLYECVAYEKNNMKKCKELTTTKIRNNNLY